MPLAILLAHPFNQTGIDDDWSYARVAMKFAQTGRIQYNGWGSPLQLIQTLWAAPWIRIFGFSFGVLQVSTIAWSLGFVLLVYATGLRLGLSRELSAFAAIGTGTSPLFLPFAASFMTEPCACFFSAACICCALRALQERLPSAAKRWLWLLALAGLLGGANRQSVWAAPLALIPCIAWERRSDPALRNHAVAAFGALIAGIMIILHKFSPPYVGLQIDRPFLSWLLIHRAGAARELLAGSILLCVLLALPAFVVCLPQPRRERRFRWALAALAVPLVTAMGIVWGAPAAPYGNNTITIAGMAFGQQNNSAVVILPVWIMLVLTGLVDVCVVCSVVYAVKWLREGLQPRYRNAVLVLGAFTLSYIALLLPGALLEFFFDRYMLPLVPVAFWAVLIAGSRRRTNATPLAWTALFLFAGYGVATTHDYNAALRARTSAARLLEQSGVHRARISASMEYDGWGQLERTEHVTGTLYSDHLTDDSSKGFWFEAWDHFADLKPDFVLLNRIDPKPPQVGESAVEFTAWFPPFRRYIVVWRREDLTGQLQAARIFSETRFWR